MQVFQDLFRKASADIADGFIGVGCGVIASKEEGTVD